MKIVIIDYGSGNLCSVVNAFEALGFGDKVLISKDFADLEAATHIILPGVGAFKDCMAGLRAENGMVEEIFRQVKEKKKPFLGICVGMQVLADIGCEDGKSAGLGLIEGEIKRIEAEKVPHMGWNDLILKQKCGILDGVKDGDHVYFANSYHFVCKDGENVAAVVDYGFEMNALLVKDNIFAIQFHPEKSGEVGLRILRNFLSCL